LKFILHEYYIYFYEYHTLFLYEHKPESNEYRLFE